MQHLLIPLLSSISHGVLPHINGIGISCKFEISLRIQCTASANWGLLMMAIISRISTIITVTYSTYENIRLLMIYLWFTYDLLMIYLWFTYDHLLYLWFTNVVGIFRRAQPYSRAIHSELLAGGPLEGSTVQVDVPPSIAVTTVLIRVAGCARKVWFLIAHGERDGSSFTHRHKSQPPQDWSYGYPFVAQRPHEIFLAGVWRQSLDD